MKTVTALAAMSPGSAFKALPGPSVTGSGREQQPGCTTFCDRRGHHKDDLK
ncbi:hypothetical protein [Streptomyces sp. NPDC016845]|uniref:hypothetical protein n=1 Tax=Streptomyces sp. NPDC016845 TaxID=3364972 RepID=UPI0037BDFDB4